jgi:hypothetical protein
VEIKVISSWAWNEFAQAVVRCKDAKNIDSRNAVLQLNSFRLEAACEELNQRLKTEEDRVQTIKEDIKQAEQNQDVSICDIKLIYATFSVGAGAGKRITHRAS